jgi:hypothetical protein
MKIRKTIELVKDDGSSELLDEQFVEFDKIELRDNNSITNDPCNICGERTEPCGYDFFAPWPALICHTCAEEFAPDLFARWSQEWATTEEDTTT